MRRKNYSAVAGRSGNKLIKFMTTGFPMILGLVCITLSVLVCISVLTV